MTAEGSLSERLAAVKAGVADAASRAGRDPRAITTVVVTKFHPVALIRELYGLGVRNFGESRHQEAQAKAAELGDLDLDWHFIGQLQSKKARQVRNYARVIHSLDRSSVVNALASDTLTVDCFVQLNLTDDPARGGVADPGLEELVERVLVTPGLNLLGVMAVAPVGEEPRSAFARLRAASERIQRIAPGARSISAGMSGDYRAAILEGATHLRIGSAITGIRPVAG
ncbi:MAG TPA: YggS family pyridoxal phosphate-dependent enzyme [Lacisediminihabitans sp.]|uniref:YggS family pyridoxal phosphate-dependent enzyme n=1 Tax=Lacisediminihabitans sp. TaxID=2787631 RepID=UPI002EDB31B2